jgi:hypothetical protein
MTTEEKELQELEQPFQEMTVKEKKFVDFILADKSKLWERRNSMTRSDFYPLLDEIYEKVKEKFAGKNASYGQEQDLFYNFRQTAKRTMQAQFSSEYEDMYRVMLAYQDKHRVALANRGLDEPEFEERCIDEIVYTLLAIALHREYERRDEHRESF